MQSFKLKELSRQNRKTEGSYFRFLDEISLSMGITLLPEKEQFYFSDYVKGIFHFDIISGKITKIDPLPELSLRH